MANTNDPMKMMAEYQQAWIQAWTNGSKHCFDMWQRMIDLQQQMVEKAMQQAAAHHRTHVEISDGPSFTDKYGKRAHDIDPERDV